MIDVDRLDLFERFGLAVVRILRVVYLITFRQIVCREVRVVIIAA